MAFDLGTVGGGPLLGVLASQFGYTVMFLTVGSVGVAAVIYYTFSSVPVWRARRHARLAGRAGSLAVDLPQTLVAASAARAHHVEQADLPQDASA